MKQFLLSLIITFSFATLSVDSYALSDDQLAEITTSLENLSTNELIERRELLLVQLDELADGDEVTFDDVDTEEEIDEDVINSILAEISVIEALLPWVGIVFADDILSDDDKDTEAPVISILGDNPATVELGSTYTDAGATADNSGSVVVTSSAMLLSVLTLLLSAATDASGNSATATRTVNVVDTTAPVLNYRWCYRYRWTRWCIYRCRSNRNW